jgi:hypothetical protein
VPLPDYTSPDDGRVWRVTSIAERDEMHRPVARVSVRFTPRDDNDRREAFTVAYRFEGALTAWEVRTHLGLFATVAWDRFSAHRWRAWDEVEQDADHILILDAQKDYAVLRVPFSERGMAWRGKALGDPQGEALATARTREGYHVEAALAMRQWAPTATGLRLEIREPNDDTPAVEPFDDVEGLLLGFAAVVAARGEDGDACAVYQLSPLACEVAHAKGLKGL